MTVFGLDSITFIIKELRPNDQVTVIVTLYAVT